MAALGTDEQNSVLDVLLVLAQNIKLLLLGPLIAALAILGFVVELAPKYLSQAVLVLPSPIPLSMPNFSPALAFGPMPLSPVTPSYVATMMESPVVLDAVADSLGRTKGAEMASSDGRTTLASQIKATVGKDGLLHLDVLASTPQEAQAVANAVIAAWLKTTVPSESERRDLQKRLTYAENGLKGVTALIEKFSVDSDRRVGSGDAGASLIPLVDLQARYLADVLSTGRAIQGLERDVIKQAPTAPTNPVPVKKSLIFTVAALATFFALLLFIFVRQVWRSAKADPSSARKQEQLLKALGIKYYQRCT